MEAFKRPSSSYTRPWSFERASASAPAAAPPAAAGAPSRTAAPAGAPAAALASFPASLPPPAAAETATAAAALALCAVAIGGRPSIWPASLRAMRSCRRSISTSAVESSSFLPSSSLRFRCLVVCSRNRSSCSASAAARASSAATRARARSRSRETESSPAAGAPVCRAFAASTASRTLASVDLTEAARALSASTARVASSSSPPTSRAAPSSSSESDAEAASAAGGLSPRRFAAPASAPSRSSLARFFATTASSPPAARTSLRRKGSSTGAAGAAFGFVASTPPVTRAARVSTCACSAFHSVATTVTRSSYAACWRFSAATAFSPSAISSRYTSSCYGRERGGWSGGECPSALARRRSAHGSQLEGAGGGKKHLAFFAGVEARRKPREP